MPSMSPSVRPPLTPTSLAWRVAAVAGFCLVAGAAVTALPRIGQDPHYHDFADGRTLLGVPNLLNVASNLPFAVVGAAGLATVFSPPARRLSAAERASFALMFAGVAATSVGSAYYHWFPDNATLVWDRLPMTAAFMGFFAAVIAERVSVRAAGWLLAPLAAAGLAAAWYWHLTELRGQGDLRPYILVQFLPLAALPLILALFPCRYLDGRTLMAGLGWYAAAKACEHFDRPVYDALGGAVSGHTFKHILAAAGVWWLLRALRAGLSRLNEGDAACDAARAPR
jgi:hypothetical protein